MAKAKAPAEQPQQEAITTEQLITAVNAGIDSIIDRLKGATTTEKFAALFDTWDTDKHLRRTVALMMVLRCFVDLDRVFGFVAKNMKDLTDDERSAIATIIGATEAIRTDKV